MIQILKLTGETVHERVSRRQTVLDLSNREIVGVSDNVAALTSINSLWLERNFVSELPAGVFAMTQLTDLDVTNNRLLAIRPEIGRLRALKLLFLDNNRLVSLPSEIGLLRKLERLSVRSNALTSLPAELGKLRLAWLFLQNNQLSWLPLSLTRLPRSTKLLVSNNPLQGAAPGGIDADSRNALLDIVANTTALATIREEATTLTIGLQDLELPALVTLEILDAAWQNSIPMHKKWDLVVAVKHFRAK